MTDDRKAQLQQISALLAERRKFETWLAALDSRRDGTPTHVTQRVETDYRAKLAEAQLRLSQEMGAVKLLVEQLEQDLASHDETVNHKRDERAEGELRAAVGEFSAKEWDKVRAKVDAALEQLERERDVVAQELETMQALLGEVAPVAPVARQDKQEPRAPKPTRTSGPLVDDLAFLRDTLGETSPAPSPAAPRRSSPDSARPQPRSGGFQAQSAGEATELEPFAAPDQALPMTEDQARESGVFDRGAGAFGMKTPGSAEIVKTLKCGECGTMNHPTEWYCEKCGGELAAF